MMGRTPGRGRPSIVLLALCVLLGWLAVAEAGDPGYLLRSASQLGLIDEIGNRNSGLPKLPAPAALVARSGYDLPPADAFAEIATRTLFNPTRRPIEAPPPPTPVEVVQPSRFTLIGVLISDGTRMALIRRGHANDYVQVHERQEVDGWRIEKIDPERIVISKGDSREELVLTDRPSPRATPRGQDPRLGPVPPRPPRARE